MNNITSITALITALRAETQERSITPERVGALLQQLANLIANCTTDTQFTPIYENAVLNIQGTVSRTANGMTLNLTLLDALDVDTPVNISIPIATRAAAGVLSATDYAAIMDAISNVGAGSGTGSGMTEAERTLLNSLASHFVRIGAANGVWVSTNDAEVEAAKLEYCANPDIWFMYYYVRGSKYGLIEQHVCDDTCIQILHWDSGISQRTITFSDTDRTAISNVGTWTAMKNTTAAEVTKLQGLPDAATILADNFGIRFLGNVGAASSVGESTAATLEIAGNERIIWIIYTYSSYTAMIHQTHNGTTTVQDMFFAGNRLSRRTITFTSAERTVISSVGSWTAVGTDIGVSRSATTATIKIPHPFMEKTAGLLSLVIGQANENYAGLMTKENLRTLNYLDQTVETMFEDVNELKNDVTQLQNDIQGLRDTISHLYSVFVLKPLLLATANPSTINIPVNQTTSSGGTIRSNVDVQINLMGYDENENTVDAMDCNVSWRFSPDAGPFHVENESMKRYVTLYADAGDTWSGTDDARLILTLTNYNNNVSGEVEVVLHRQAS